MVVNSRLFYPPTARWEVTEFEKKINEQAERIAALEALLPDHLPTVEELEALTKVIESVRFRFNAYDFAENSSSSFMAHALAKYGYRFVPTPESGADAR